MSGDPDLEASLRESERRLAVAMEGSGDGLWDWNIQSGEQWLNDRWAQMLGYEPSEIAPSLTGWTELIHPDDLGPALRAVDALLDGTTDHYLFEHRLRRRDGSYAWILDRGRVVEWDDEGRPLRAAGTHTDVTARHEAEDALRATTERLGRLMASMHDGVLVFDAAGRLVSLNPRAAELIDVVADDVLGLPREQLGWDVIDVDGRPLTARDAASRQVLATGDPVTDRVIGIRRRDGRIVWLNQNVVPGHRGPSGEILEVITTLSDITRLRETQARLAADEARFREVLETATDAVWVLEERRLVWANPATARVFGRPLEDLVGRRITELFDPEDEAHIEARLGAMRHGDTADVERRIRRPDGEERWIEIRAHHVGDGRTEAVARDVTGRKALEAERDLLLAAVEHAADGIVLADADLRVTYMNAGAEHLTGYPRSDVLGRPVAFASTPESAAEVGRATAAVGAGEPWAGDISLRKADGSVVTLAVRTSPVAGAGARQSATLLIARDVTWEREVGGRLAEAARMESVGQLAGGVAHDFNNILTAIIGYGELLAGELPEGSQAAEDLAQILRGADRAQSLTRQLLAFSRRLHLQPRDVALGDVVASLEPMLQRLIGEDITLRVERHDDAGPVHVDVAMLEHAVTNLVVNARDAMPAGGPIRIVTRASDLPGWAAVEIVDAGQGIAPDVIGRIFEPFFTTKEVGAGTGLGLSMVQGFVTQSGGRLTVDSTPGRGSTFAIHLPVVEPSSPMVDNERPAAAPRGRGRILVVEDEPILAELASRILERAGFEVLAVPSGTVALELLADPQVPADLLFTDVVMPGVSGAVLAERAGQLRPGLPVLFASGYTADEMRRRGIRLEDVAFLVKPFHPDQLLEAVASVMARTS